MQSIFLEEFPEQWCQLWAISEAIQVSPRMFFSKVFGARNTTRTIHSPVGIPLPEAVRNMSTPHFIPPSLLHACCILPPLLQSHSYTIPHHLLFLLKVGFSQQPKVMFFFFYSSLLQLWMKMFNNLFGIMCIHLCNKFYNGFNCPHVSQTEGTFYCLINKMLTHWTSIWLYM